MPDLTFQASVEDIHGKSETEKDGSRLPYIVLKLRASVPPEQIALLFEVLETGLVKVRLTEVQGRLGTVAKQA